MEIAERTPAPSPLLKTGRHPTSVRVVTPSYYNMNQQYCLPSEERNSVSKNPQKILVFCTFWSRFCGSHIYSKYSGFGGLEVACWPNEAVGFLGQKKILSTPSFGEEVKPSVPCRSFTACKRSLNVTWKSIFKAKLPDISRPQFHLPPLVALAW
jgi:hypothetical protein